MKTLLLTLMAPQGGGDAGSGMISTIVMFALIIFIFYFMIIRPQSKRQKERQKMLDALKKGDKVVTSGGLHGRVVGLEDKTVLVEIAENVKVKVEKSAVAAVIQE
ncbi:MAG: preprotein translocase subunit YajC [Candidatus Kryptoniota bacterium]